MAETLEGIGGRKWSYEPTGAGLALCEGKTQLATLAKDGNSVKLLLVSSPQLWDAANELVKLAEQVAGGSGPAGPAYQRLKDMVAKSVGKDDWAKVLQA